MIKDVLSKIKVKKDKEYRKEKKAAKEPLKTNSDYKKKGVASNF